jgi:hypothetical protein
MANRQNKPDNIRDLQEAQRKGLKNKDNSLPKQCLTGEAVPHCRSSASLPKQCLTADSRLPGRTR